MEANLQQQSAEIVTFGICQYILVTQCSAETNFVGKEMGSLRDVYYFNNKSCQLKYSYTTFTPPSETRVRPLPMESLGKHV